MLISLSKIYGYLQAGRSASEASKLRCFEQGEQLFLAGHIVGCGYEGDKIVSRCITSKITAQPHRIELMFVNAQGKYK